MNIYELSNVLLKLKYKDFSHDEIKNINYNNRENILVIKCDKDFSIEANLNENTIKRVLDLKDVIVHKI